VLRLFWHCLDPGKGDEEFVTSAFQELADLLRQPPVEAEFQATPLTGQVAETVAEEFIRYAGGGPREGSGAVEVLTKSQQDKAPSLAVSVPQMPLLDAASRDSTPGAMIQNPVALTGREGSTPSFGTT